MPPFFFLISFVPFALSSQDAFRGIINNVFLYKSSNNAPLLHVIYTLIGAPEKMYLIVYFLILCILAYVIRCFGYEETLGIYLIAMVTFLSAIFNQYLVIPLAALFFLDNTKLKYAYIIFNTVFLTFEMNG